MCLRRYATNYTGKSKRDTAKASAKEVTSMGLEHLILPLILMSCPQSTVHGIDVSASKAAVDLTALSPLEIPGSTDIAVEKYTEWLVSTVERDTLKAAFRQTCDVMLENGLDLEQVYKDQDPNFFIERGIKIGIARRFVENIAEWVKKVKKAVPVYEILNQADGH
ncbi:hypothetical protein N7451_009161 [Penicillium sp. IBT 35674x]|nr:hypothetical protein N7451_009161 [Penicillium sp. IBT 35674x]